MNAEQRKHLRKTVDNAIASGRGKYITLAVEDVAALLDLVEGKQPTEQPPSPEPPPAKPRRRSKPAATPTEQPAAE